MNGGGVSLLPTSSCNFSVTLPPIFEKNVVYNIVSNGIRKGYFMGKRQFFVAVVKFKLQRYKKEKRPF